MVKKIIAVVCIIAVFCCLAAVDVIKQQNVTVSKHFDELEIAFTATDHTASIVESKDYVFYAATDGIYRKEKNGADLCTRIVKGAATALQVFSNTLYYVTNNGQQLCSVDFNGKNFNEVYEKPQDYVNRTITDYVAFGNGLVIADSAFPLYYDIINKKQYNIFEKPRELNAYDVYNQSLYYGHIQIKNLSNEKHIYDDIKYNAYGSAFGLEFCEIVAGEDCVYALSSDRLLYKIGQKEMFELINFSNEKIQHIKKSGDYLYIMFEKHAERLLLTEEWTSGEYIDILEDYNGGYFGIAEDRVYYKTKDGYKFAEWQASNRVSGYFFRFNEAYWFETCDSVHTKRKKVKISDTKIVTREDMVEFAKKEFKNNEDPYFLLTDVTWYQMDNIWEFTIVDRIENEEEIKFPEDSLGITTAGMFAMDGETGMRIEETHYEWIRNRRVH